MILEHGSIKGLSGAVCVLKNDDGKICYVLPLLCRRFHPLKDTELRTYVEKITGCRIKKMLSSDMEWIAAHLKGKKNFSLSGTDLDAVPEFRRSVYKALSATRPGQLLTYGQLGLKAGRSGSARAVGTAMSSNPFPLIVPCHRVGSASGTERFSIPCMKKKPAGCSVSDLDKCSREMKSAIREFEKN